MRTGPGDVDIACAIVGYGCCFEPRMARPLIRPAGIILGHEAARGSGACRQISSQRSRIKVDGTRKRPHHDLSVSGNANHVIHELGRATVAQSLGKIKVPGHQVASFQVFQLEPAARNRLAAACRVAVLLARLIVGCRAGPPAKWEHA